MPREGGCGGAALTSAPTGGALVLERPIASDSVARVLYGPLRTYADRWHGADHRGSLLRLFREQVAALDRAYWVQVDDHVIVFVQK